MELCARAADEQDPDKLLALITEINLLLEEKSSAWGSVREQTRLAELPNLAARHDDPCRS